MAVSKEARAAAVRVCSTLLHEPEAASRRRVAQMTDGEVYEVAGMLSHVDEMNEQLYQIMEWIGERELQKLTTPET